MFITVIGGPNHQKPQKKAQKMTKTQNSKPEIRIVYTDQKRTSGPTMLLAWLFAIIAVMAFIDSPTGGTHHGKAQTNESQKVTKNVQP